MQKPRSRPQSAFGKQLREKQELKRMFGMRERQFRRFYTEAAREARTTPGLATGVALLQKLESRLDNVVYRLGLTRTRRQARQLVSQGHILVDDSTVTIPSYQVRPGQKVALNPKLFENPFFQDILREVEKIPDWLEVKGTAGYMKRKPTREEIDQTINEDLVVSFYTKK